ncbi:hypothetical protein Y032_0126g1307 [Ancylostoma ceylanicum]|nr:hypothetical protein Y032_0126g1307 [Ancylostoma ceylanicum]
MRGMSVTACQKQQNRAAAVLLSGCAISLLGKTEQPRRRDRDCILKTGQGGNAKALLFVVQRRNCNSMQNYSTAVISGADCLCR